MTGRLFGPREPGSAFSEANIVTLLRLGGSLVFFVLAAVRGDPTVNFIGLGIHWLGDVLDGVLRPEGPAGDHPRGRDRHHRRPGRGPLLLRELPPFPSRVAVATAIYVLDFAFVDFYLSYQFLKFDLISPNYFCQVDRRVYRLNFSPGGKFVNSTVVTLVLIFLPALAGGGRGPRRRAHRRQGPIRSAGWSGSGRERRKQDEARPAHVLSLAARGAANYLGRGPLCVSFEITYNCNARCKHCHLGGPRPGGAGLARGVRQDRPESSSRSWPRSRAASPSSGRTWKRSSGRSGVPAEPPFIVLTTNGSLLTREKYDRLREAGVDEISLSLDYPDERHDEFRGIPGLFREDPDPGPRH